MQNRARLKFRFAFFLAAASVLVGALAHAETVSSPAGFSPEELLFLRGLELDKYVMHASCAEIANTLLTPAGLPRLGETTAVLGTRMDLDRRGERASPPWFVDSVLRRERPYEAYRIEAHAEGIYWILKRTRELRAAGQSPRKLETGFVFRLESRLNQPACELETIRFKSRAWAEDLDAQDCIALRGLDPSTSRSWVKEPGIFPWAKEDCDLGLHYFRTVKEALLIEAKRRVR
jgi:hypothetical protein